MNRNSIILTGIDVENSTGLEIGPLRSPIVKKNDGQVSYLDHLSTKDLQSKYKGHNFDVNEIVNVDYVWQPHLSLREVTGGQSFDYVIASHVFEHIPNPIKWMAEIWEILETNGKLSLAIPDKRFCFDYLRSLSSTGDIIEPFLKSGNKPSVKAVFDAISNATSYQGNIAWAGHINTTQLHKIHTLEEALEIAQNVAQIEIYHDVHSWCLTPTSFFRILRDLIQLGLVNFSVSHFHNTVGHEFYITLKKESKDTEVTTLLETIPDLDDEDITIPKDFNSQVYLELNPDISISGCDPVQHFIHHGRGESRRYK